MFVPSKAMAPGVSVSPVYVAVLTVGATVTALVDETEVGVYTTVKTLGSPVALKPESVPLVALMFAAEKFAGTAGNEMVTVVPCPSVRVELPSVTVGVSTDVVVTGSTPLNEANAESGAAPMAHVIRRAAVAMPANFFITLSIPSGTVE